MEYRIEKLGQLLHDASRAIRRRFEARMACYGLSATQWRLIAIILQDGPQTQATLADRLDVEPISVSRLIDRMEQSGWVQREPHPDDRRARIIVATEKTRSIAPEARATIMQVYDEALAHLSDDHRRILHAGLRSVIDATACTDTPRPDCAAPLIPDETEK